MIKLIAVVVLVLVLVFSSSSLFASALSSESLSRTSLKNLKEQSSFHQIGETTFSIFFWDLYKSRLVTTSGKYPLGDVNEQLIYEINYMTDISREDLIERTVEQWQYLGLPIERYQQFLPTLANIWPDIIEGDTLSLLMDHKVSAFYFNQQYIGSIDVPEFGQMFLDIWLAENTSQPKLRLQLLGQTRHE